MLNTGRTQTIGKIELVDVGLGDVEYAIRAKRSGTVLVESILLTYDEKELIERMTAAYNYCLVNNVKLDQDSNPTNTNGRS